jgi:RNA polymerase sigma-70 factor (ECF subfamily)
MRETDPFHDLFARVRAGDPEAATELVRQYEPAILRAVRIWLIDARLRRAFDSMDICQSVFGSFFVRVALGQYQLDQPAQLIQLLVSMARHKLADQARKEQAECRDHRRLDGVNIERIELFAKGASPSQEVAGAELLEEFRKRLSDDERLLANLRAQGREWTEIAAEVGGSPEALRKKLARAINRVSRELDLDELDHE